MYKLDLTEGKYPVIIKPNLGQPILINLRDFKSDGKFNKKIIFEGLILTIPNQNTEEILRYFNLNTFIQPILKDEGDFADRRGERIPLNIISIDPIINLDFRKSNVLEEENCLVWDIFNSLLQIDGIFGERNQLLKIQFQIKNEKMIEDLLQKVKRSSAIFDLVHDLPNSIERKINYHAIAIFDKDWSSFKFVHSTDFHVDQRTDFISKFLKDKALDKLKRSSSRKIFPSKKIPFVLRRDFEFKKGFQENKLDKLRYAKYNFNYNLRLLIRFINEKVKANDLDFVLMTGDLVDYIDIARGNYLYENNYFVFIEILLGLNRGLDKYPYFTEPEYVNEKEVLAPVFIMVGNHDYRKGHYSLRFGSSRKIYGLTKKDIKGYYDLKFSNYFTALRSRLKYLRDYFRYINPNLNFNLKIGNDYNFIFLETGRDSTADLHDLLSGGPSTKGLKDYQIDLLRAYIKLAHDKKIIVVMHTPPISPNLGASKQRKFKRKFNLKRKIEWKDFYEENLKKYFGDGRVDKVLNLKYQCIMYNWATLLKIFTGSDEIIRRKVDLIICGHTHTLKEFRLTEAKKSEIERINYGYLFFPYYVKVPCKIYASKYRDKFEEIKNSYALKLWFDVNKPFIFQTQAIGPISLKYKFTPPGFRFYEIKDNQIIKIDVYSLHLIDK